MTDPKQLAEQMRRNLDPLEKRADQRQDEQTARDNQKVAT